MIDLKSKRVYNNFHVVCIVFAHITLVAWYLLQCVQVFVYIYPYTYIYIYIYIYIWHISYTGLFDFYDFQDPILWNYVSNCNEIYAQWREGYVELTYQVWSKSDNLV